MTFRLLYLFLAISCCSCGAEKAEMLAAFEEIQTLANSGDKEELYELLDRPSQELVDKFTDTNFVTTVKLSKEGDTYKLNLISLMQARERIYKQELRAFTDLAGAGGNELQRFAESRTDETYQLKELQYRRE